MSLNFRSNSLVESTGHEEMGTNSHPRDEFITMLVASLAVLIVATIAVLMGMA